MQHHDDDYELPEGLSKWKDGKIMANCRRCGNAYEWEVEVELWSGEDNYYNLCGGDQHCIP